ncbi:MAG TPA: hypothetical protein VM577_19495 [Anaerovoracaceae bacterium]|nr:hypothetical protein [Anaerovoracaceae bacterium]
MARRNESPEYKRRREFVQGFLKDNPINDPNDIQELMKEMMRQVLQGGLEAELDEELGYARYDYRNKETDNSYGCHSFSGCGLEKTKVQSSSYPL